MFQEHVGDGAGGQLLQLSEQRRGKVECGGNSGKPIEQEGHVEIGLGGVEAHPRHAGRSRDRVGIVGLMHVPQEAQRDAFHAPALVGVRTAAVEYVMRVMGSQLFNRSLRDR